MAFVGVEVPLNDNDSGFTVRNAVPKSLLGWEAKGAVQRMDPCSVVLTCRSWRVAPGLWVVPRS